MMEMRLVYLDPYTLKVSSDNEDILQKSTQFFSTLFKRLADGKVRLIIDQYFKQVINEREVLPFPICAFNTHNDKLKSDISKVNNAFILELSNKLIYVNILTCPSIPDVQSNISHLINEPGYCELLYTFVSECEKDNIRPTELLVNEDYTKITEESINVRCNCSTNVFNHDYNVITIDQLTDEKEDAKTILKSHLNMSCNGSLLKVVQAAHEPVIGNTVINEFSQIPRQLRKVLGILIYFGLKKIHIHDWDSHRGEVGSIRKCVLYLENENESIIEGYLIGDNSMSFKVHLYFPPEVGKNILSAFGADLTYNLTNNFMNTYR